MKNCFYALLLMLHFATSFGDNCLNVRNFGALGNGTTNDFTAFQNAIDSAKITGATVCIPPGVYKIDSTLTISSGVSLLGEGIGSEVLQTPYNGSLIVYTGTGIAFCIKGSGVSISNLTLLDNNNTGASGGIKIESTNKLIENVMIKNVLISGFTTGTALQLSATNSAGISYCSFYDVRIRHGLIGIHLYQDATSFVNSNSFYHGAISGGGFNKGLHVEGGNNNLFFGTVIEPPTSTNGHIVVEKGQIIGEEIRIEGSAQSTAIPLIHFNVNANESFLSGHFSGGSVVNNGNNIIALNSSKYVGESNSTANLLVNSNFYSNTPTALPHFWESTGNGVNTSIETPSIVNNFWVLKIAIPQGIVGKINPTNNVKPLVNSHASYNYSNFNVYMKTSTTNLAKVVMNSSTGLASSNYHSGNGAWELIGLQTLKSSSGPDPKIWIDNTNGTDTVFVYITSPSFTYGQTFPSRTANTITGEGGIITGTLTSGYSSNYTFLTGTTYLVLNRQGNYFDVTGSGITIDRINHQTADQFPKGTVITLLFDTLNNKINSSAYIKLSKSFSTGTTNSSITLISNGNGTWREVGRNN